MLGFTFKKYTREERKEVYVPEKNIRRKQVVFSSLFFIFILSICAYMIYRIEVETFDGYLRVRSNDIRLVDDAFIIHNRVNSGEFVKEGDTLFSYVLTGFFVDAINPSNITSAQSEINRLYLRSNELRVERSIVTNKIDSLQSILNRLENDVHQGIETIHVVEAKKWELFTAKEELRRLQLLSNVTSSAYRDALRHIGTPDGDHYQTPSMYSTDFLRENEGIFGNSLLYRVASEDLVVLDAPIREGALVYKKESVMTVLYTGTSNLSDIHALAFVSPASLPHVEENQKVKVYVGNEFIAEGTITLSVSRMYDVNPSKLGIIKQSGEAVAVRIDFDKYQQILQKYQINNLPVKIKYRKGVLFK